MAQTAIKDQMERKIEVNREKLLETLKKNREKHGKDYQEAVEGYKTLAMEKLKEGHERAQKELKENFERYTKRIQDFDPKNPKGSDYLTLVNGINVEMKLPRDYTAKYDAAIDMVSWDVRETLELTHAEFQCFVRDVWDWSDEFRIISEGYKSSR